MHVRAVDVLSFSINVLFRISVIRTIM